MCWRARLLGALLLGALPPHSASQPPNTDSAFIKQVLDEHNKARAEVQPPAANMLYMSWDSALSNLAKTWSEECIFGFNPELLTPGSLHPKFSIIGENMWIGPPNSDITATKEWASEAKDYNFAPNECSGECSHYTQVVWATSYKIGCAATLCRRVKNQSSRNMMLLVCNYGPAGNFPTQPYKKGEPCSECPVGETCEANLCRNATRDVNILDTAVSKESHPLDHLLLCLLLFHYMYRLFYVV
ncbi:glioma pathogenesis-related protein 1-like isoform X2 [Ambystoma mexicanum]|uniref:glioma pathogenesis-related protein 1-like isoform X2 n=1 Tax=Ambystoma mexicanum TaxID=8296 RepID=UPI0037E8EEFD